MLRHGKYRTGLSERLGTVPDRLFNQVAVNTIWIHAVSVGEVLAISRVVEELKAELPGWRLVVSTTTDTGQKLARERFGENNVFYLPLDLPFAVRAYLQALRPKLLVLAESEFWPNLLRWARLCGNLKFEVKPPSKPPIIAPFTAALQREEIGPLLLAGSTLEGEEAMLLETFRQVVSRYPSALLVLAPRHPERFEPVASLLESSGVRYQRRSQWDGLRPLAGGIFLLDSIGELASLYEFADLAFIGGSLVPRGGHNVLEAALFATPI